MLAATPSHAGGLTPCSTPPPRMRSPQVSYSYSGYMPLDAIADMKLIGVSLVIVFGYMVSQLGSPFVAACGMAQIFSSFFGANLLYRYVWPSSDGFGFKASCFVFES